MRIPLLFKETTFPMHLLLLRNFFLITALFIASACSKNTDSSSSSSTPSGQRPNIIFVMTDDHTHLQMSLTGNSLINTPNLDRLANEGVWFKNAFCTNSLCAPARATILTGCLSHYDVHVQLDADKDLIDKYLNKERDPDYPSNAVYAAMIEHVDDSVGDLMQAVEELEPLPSWPPRRRCNWFRNPRISERNHPLSGSSPLSDTQSSVSIPRFQFSNYNPNEIKPYCPSRRS